MEHSRILSITENGKHVVSGYDLAEVDVYIPPFAKTLSEEGVLASISLNNNYNGVMDLRGLNVSTMRSIPTFNGSLYVKSINLSGWDVSNFRNLAGLFLNCRSAESIDLTGWKVGKIATLSYTFYWCQYVTTLDIANWDTSEVTNMTATFQQCKSVVTLDVSRWDTSNVTTMNILFGYCANLEMLDLTKWNVANVTNFSLIFQDCYKLKSIVGSRSLDEVVRNNIGAMNDARIDYSVNSCPLDVASLVALFNGVADLTGQASKTITVGKTNLAKLTPEQIAIATNKNWNVV